MFDRILRSRSNDGLSLDEMRAKLPAIFADHPHHETSDKYVYISTVDIIETLAKEGFVPHEARVSRSRSFHKQSYAKHMLRFRNSSAQLQVGDTFFEVVMRNAHDGSGAYDFLAGLFVLTCLNGNTIGEGTVAAVHVRHAGNRQKVLDKVVEGAHAVLENAQLALEAPRKWSQIELHYEEQQALAESARIVRFGDAQGNVNSPITARQLLIARRPGDEGNSLWKTYQRIQESCVRGGLSALGRTSTGQLRQSTTKEIKGIDGDLKLNRALWQLADKMAKLKEAGVSI